MLYQIKANFYRIFKKKSNCLLVVICFAIGLTNSLLYKFSNSGAIADLSLIFIAIMVPAFLSLNFTNGLIRNKLLAGNSKTSIYCAELFTSWILGSILWLLYQIPVLIFVALKDANLSIVALISYLPIGLVGVFGLSSIFTFIGINITSQRAGIICLIITFLILVMSTIPAILSFIPIVGEKTQKILLVIARLLPVQLLSGYLDAGVYRSLYIVGGIIFIAVFTTCGLILIQKRNYK